MKMGFTALMFLSLWLKEVEMDEKQGSMAPATDESMWKCENWKAKKNAVFFLAVSHIIIPHPTTAKMPATACQ